MGENCSVKEKDSFSEHVLLGQIIVWIAIEGMKTQPLTEPLSVLFKHDRRGVLTQWKTFKVRKSLYNLCHI